MDCSRTLISALTLSGDILLFPGALGQEFIPGLSFLLNPHSVNVMSGLEGGATKQQYGHIHNYTLNTDQNSVIT